METYFYFIWIVILGIGILSVEFSKGKIENKSPTDLGLVYFFFYSPSIIFGFQAGSGFSLSVVLAIC